MRVQAAVRRAAWPPPMRVRRHYGWGEVWTWSGARNHQERGGDWWWGCGETRAAVVGTTAAAVGWWHSSTRTTNRVAECEEEEDVEVVNWSGTHSCRASKVYTPETTAEAAKIVARCHASGERVRPCGSTLSPNGVGFCAEGSAMLNMSLCDRILEVDAEKRTVRVECGARVEDVLAALAPHGLTLENLASIAAQQIGGFVQVGAHGTGATLPPVDGQVERLVLATPGRGVVELARGSPFFDVAVVGLGGLGVCLEATLRCVPRHLLREKVEVLTRAEAKARHAAILRDNRHARLMWIPHVDAVVCVTNNPTLPPPLGDGQGTPPTASLDHRLAPLRDLLRQVRAEKKNTTTTTVLDDVDELNFAQLRDELLALDPLSLAHVKRVNAAETEFWRRSQGVDVADSSLKLNFECGGQQWVNECAFPAGSLDRPSGADVQFMLDLLALIEADGIPAPAPIEQRWTAASTAKMSPASGHARRERRGRASPGSEDESQENDALHSWVGIIMYLPTDDPAQRADITAAFDAYKRRCEDLLWPKYRAVEHWAKIELPDRPDRARVVRARLADRFPVHDFAVARKYFDPKNILGNELLDTILPPAS